MDIKNHKPTLEQLQEFTDAELSQSVFRKMHPTGLIPQGEVPVDKNGLCRHFDINNWSNMGALANKYKIGAIPTFSGWNAFHSDNDGRFVFDVHDKNELRAKAIVFLMMDI